MTPHCRGTQLDTAELQKNFAFQGVNTPRIFTIHGMPGLGFKDSAKDGQAIDAPTRAPSMVCRQARSPSWKAKGSIHPGL